MTNSNSDAQITVAQIEEFKQQTRLAKQVLGEDIEVSLFASHGLVRWARRFPTDWVRPGILLYGEHNFVTEQLEPEALELIQEFKPAVSLRARIIHRLAFSVAENVGYGQLHTVRPGQRLATVAMGFGGGYPASTGKAYALVNGQRVPVFGEVGMDALQLDVGDVPDVKLYDWATLIGRDGTEHISARDLAHASEVSPYELLRGLHCYRQYVNSESVAR